MEYIQNHNRPDDCIFCQAAALEDGPGNLIIYRGEAVFVILNRFPYTSGHMMVVPYAHVPSLELLDPQSRAEMMELSTHGLEVLRVVYTPDAFNMGANIGEAAGAGIADHFHIHVVPRWVGDTNFMTALGETRVLPENLTDTYQRIRDAWVLPDRPG